MWEEKKFLNKRFFKTRKENYNLLEVGSKSYCIEGDGVIEREMTVQKTILMKMRRGNGVCTTEECVQGLRKGLFYMDN